LSSLFNKPNLVALATSRRIAQLKGLETLLNARLLHVSNLEFTSLKYVQESTIVVGWGAKRTADKARSFATKNILPHISLEDGFLRSVSLGKHDPPLSIVLDDLGIYYDASRPSRLEALIESPGDPAFSSRARKLIALWRSARLSKYNYAREYSGDLPSRYVLVADQTLGDSSIQYGQADESSFHRMLEAALAENPGCTVLLKVHPEVVFGRKKGHFDIAAISKNPRIKVLGEEVHPARLIEYAEAIYVVTSQIGFEGLLWGKRVRTFGMPFYAGWCLTEDEITAPERRKPVALENLVHATLVEYPRYIDPETMKSCQPERLMEWMGLQRQMLERFPKAIHALGFHPWKKPVLRRFFQGSQVKFVKRVEEVPDGVNLVVWGRREVAGHRCVGVIRLEDGFLRSVGLGANLVRPLSWVMDMQGMYYDATRASDLEQLLQETRFDSELVVRASILRRRIIEHGITKYNIGTAKWKRPQTAKRVILVPGQVEGDFSIVFGSPYVRRNMDLLRAVREANMDAYIVYKPHPDIVAGLRMNDGEEKSSCWCDEEVLDSPMGELLEDVDEVHTITSLSGFEGLLRGKKVVTYGQPFYAGWGLTEDRHPIKRRTRRLMMEELIAGVLILYPTYVSSSTGRFTTPERALEELLAWRAHGSSSRLPLRRRVWIRFLEGIKNYVPQIG